MVVSAPLRWLSLLVLSGLLLGCSPPVPAASGSANPSSDRSSGPAQTNSPAQTAASQQSGLGQVLPISAQVQVANQVIQLEVAKTESQQAMGLMHRTRQPDDRGMLFPFQPARRVGFWMKNVEISLDMVFLRNGRVEAIANNVPPCQTDPCPVYGPSVPIDQVIELRGGRAAELGIKVGDRLKVQPL